MPAILQLRDRSTGTVMHEQPLPETRPEQGSVINVGDDWLIVKEGYYATQGANLYTILLCEVVRDLPPGAGFGPFYKLNA